MAFSNVNLVSGLYPTFIRGGSQPQKPPDLLIQQFVDDAANMIVSVLLRRFSESIAQAVPATLTAWLKGLGLPNTTWFASSAYALGATIIDPNIPPGVWRVTTAGTTGSSQPAWTVGAVPGATQVDGSVTWTNVGRSAQFCVLEIGNRYRAAYQLGMTLASYGVAGARDLSKYYNDGEWTTFWNEMNAVDKSGKPRSAGGGFDVLFDALASVQSPRPGLVYIAGGDQPISNVPANENISNLLGKFGQDYGRYGGQYQNGAGGGGWWAP